MVQSSRPLKDACSSYPKIVRKLLVVSDRCLPSLTPLEVTCAYHPLINKLAYVQSRIDIYILISTKYS